MKSFKQSDLKQAQKAYNLASAIVNSSLDELSGVNDVMIKLLKAVYLVVHFSENEELVKEIGEVIKEDLYEGYEMAITDEVNKPHGVNSHSHKYIQELDSFIELFKQMAIREWQNKYSLGGILKELVDKLPTAEQLKEMPELLNKVRPEVLGMIKEMNLKV